LGSQTGGDPPVAPPGAPSPLARGTEKGKRAGPGARIQSPGTMKHVYAGLFEIVNPGWAAGFVAL
jgi:hypothetical protein